MKKSQQWDEKSSETNQTPKRANHMDNSFNSVVDEWSKQMAIDTMGSKNKNIELLKSQS